FLYIASSAHAGGLSSNYILVLCILSLAHLHFLLVVSEPPGATLFPYTTLFRSRRGHRLDRRLLALDDALGATVVETAGGNDHARSQKGADQSGDRSHQPHAVARVALRQHFGRVAPAAIIGRGRGAIRRRAVSAPVCGHRW